MKTHGLGARLRHELLEYAINVVYLTLVFGAFTLYRRLLLAANDIPYAHYGIAIIEALILGKVIMIGSLFRLGRRLESEPLIFSTLYKSMVFSIFVAIFKVLEEGIRGLFTREGFFTAIIDTVQNRRDEVLANFLVVFVALIPFFAIKELERTLGRDMLTDLFFRSHPPRNPHS